MAKLGPGAACCGQPAECEIECDLTSPSVPSPLPVVDEDETAEEDE